MSRSFGFLFSVLLLSAGVASAAVPVTNDLAVTKRFVRRDYVIAVDADLNFTGAFDRGVRRKAVAERIGQLENDLKSLERIDRVRDALWKAYLALDQNVGTWTNWTKACKAISPLQDAIDVSDGINSELSSLSATRLGAIESWGELRDVRGVLGDDCMSTWVLKSTQSAKDVESRIFDFITTDIPTLEAERANLLRHLVILKDQAADLGPVDDQKVSDSRDVKNAPAPDAASGSTATAGGRAAI